jgi:ELWxxDGT repeat protein
MKVTRTVSRLFRDKPKTRSRQFRPNVMQLESRKLLATLIDLDSTPYHGNPGEFVELNGSLIFAARGFNSNTLLPSQESELWRSDGTPEGTFLLKNIRPDVGSNTGSNPRGFTRIGNIVYFSADDGFSGEDLWRTDGTSAGTFRVKDLPSQTVFVNEMTALGDRLLFTAQDGFGQELWVSDGTSVGTVRITDINPGSGNGSPTDLTVFNNEVYFGAYESTGGLPILYKSDGTPGGTMRVPKDAQNAPIAMRTSAFSGEIELEVAGNALYFIGADSQSGRELWKTDGTLAGTGIVKELVSGSASANLMDLTGVGDRLLFRATVGGATELWASDGTAAGTASLGAVNPTSIYVVGERAFFRQAPGATGGTDLWVTDGTVGGTQFVATVVSMNTSSLMGGIAGPDGNFYFDVLGSDGNRELWTSDGTSGGTKQVRDGLSPGYANYGIAGGKVYLSADGGTGLELWTTDGTEGGTSLVKEIAPGTPGSSPSNYVEMNGVAYFAVQSNSNSQVRGLWQTDGTKEGTVLVRSFVAGAPSNLVRVGETIFFSAGDNLTGIELWKTDGTPGGTVLVKDIRPGNGGSGPAALQGANGILYFRADDGSGSGSEVWRSDGTSAGTYRLKDIEPANGQSSFAANFLAYNGKTYFTAHDSVEGSELWRTDGTESGTIRVTSVVPGNGTSTILGLTKYGNHLYFAVSPGSSTGTRLWRLDASENAAEVIDFTPGGIAQPWIPIGVAGEFLYLRSSFGSNLYRTDGTPEGTVQVHAGPVGGSISHFTAVGSDLYFFTADASGANRRIWRTNGDASVLVHALGSSYSQPLHSFIPTGSGITFAVNRTVSVNQVITEVWRSDGTPESTVFVDTVANYRSAGDVSSTLIDGRMLFTLNDGVHGAELWSVQVLNPVPTSILLDDSFVPENLPVGTAVGVLSADSGSSAAFSLVEGEGSTDNGSFSLDGNVLRTTATFDYEAQSQYAIRVRATSPGGDFIEQVFTITVLSVNEAPIARADHMIVAQDAGFVIVDVWANDSDPDGEMFFSFDSLTQGQHGTAITWYDTKLAYKPNAGFTGIDQFTYTIRDSGGALATATVTVHVTGASVVVEPDSDPVVFAHTLQTAVITATAQETPPQLVINVNSANIGSVVDAIQGVSSSEPVTIVLATNAGTYQGLTIAAPANVRVVLNGLSGQVTLVGASPALTVSSGVVELIGMTLTNDTDAPTILVTGGTLILRDSTVEESTVGDRAAIQVEGGVADLGTGASAGGNILIVHGSGLFVRNLTMSQISALGNTFLVGETPLPDAEVPGYLEGNVSTALPTAATVESVVVNGQQPTSSPSQRSMVKDLTITFSQEVSVAHLVNAFEVVRLGAGGGSVNVNVSSNVVGGKTVVLLTFSGSSVETSGSLMDGNYQLTIRSDLVLDSYGQELDGDDDGVAGGDYLFGETAADAFFRLFGDTDGDRDVDNMDAARLRGTMNKTAAQTGYLWFLDYNKDNVVNTVDNSQFLLRYAKKLTFPGST